MIHLAISLLFLVVPIYATTLRTEAHVSAWNDFKETHGKIYTSTEEESARFYIFLQNLRQIADHNKEYEAGLKSFRLAINRFGDLTSEEFGARMNGFRRPTSINTTNSRNLFASTNDELPAAVDWRTKGYVTQVKDQKRCGSCWAFSATGSLEGQHFKQTGKLVELSEQNLVDCSRNFGNEGCNGGWMDSAFQYIKANDGVDTEQSYPYEAVDRPCRFKPQNVGADDTGFVDIKQGSESDLEAAIAKVGPISVAIDASHMSFQFYDHGVYNERQCSPKNLDHGVLAVGYGVNENGEKYYIVKNSWGSSWGNQGYILMSRGKNNQCGIATAASYPTV
jgi:cathepsin L